MAKFAGRKLPPAQAALWLAAGAAAGVVLGVILADRYGGGRSLLRRAGSTLRTVGQWAYSLRELGAGEDESEDETIDEDEEEEYEYDDEEHEDAGLVRIDARVLAAFQQDPILSHRAIEIDAPDAETIILAGRVPTSRDVAHAATIARGVPGVERVENYLRVLRPRSRPKTRSTSDA